MTLGSQNWDLWGPLAARYSEPGPRRFLSAVLAEKLVYPPSGLIDELAKRQLIHETPLPVAVRREPSLETA